MKTIIIPVSSGAYCAEQLRNLLLYYSNEQLKCIFLQVREMPDNYNDLMTLHRLPSKTGSFNEHFTKNIGMLRQQFKNVVEIRVNHIYGDSAIMFKNYVEHESADLVIYDKKEWEHKPHHLNVFRMVRRCGCELMYINNENTGVVKHIRVSALEKKNTPESILYKYSDVDQQLENILNSGKILSKRMSNVSRYFLNESVLDEMLSQSQCSLLLLKK